jgi:hypothetical protein
MSLRALALVAVIAAVAPSCSCGPPGSGLAINVAFEPASVSKCTIVGVKQEGGSTTFETKGIARPSDNTLVVGVERTADIRGQLVPFARGFATANCSGTMIEEVRAATAFDLDLPGRQEVTLTFRGNNSDGGMDGGTPDAGEDDGGFDGGPNDGGCVPSMELCADGLDNDCDGLADCLDSSCTGLGCNDSNGCTTTDVCLGDGGCAGTALTCNTPAQCELAPGTCTGGVCGYDAGTGQVCNTNGICRSDKSCADGGEVFCANAIDDDTDTFTDCADPDCNNQTCDAGPSTCFLGASCVSNACAKIIPVVCTPPGVCFVSTGACVEGSGCPFRQLDAGTGCDGGLCRPDGGCTPSEQCTNGVDDDFDQLSDCADPDCNNVACDDKNACTSGTVCAAGVCGGGSICPAPTFCTGIGSCGVDGGCQFAPRLYAKCDAGFCRADGTCGAPFPFVPSNFDPNGLTVPDASVMIDCLAEFNSDPGAANGGFTNWCGPRPLVFSQNQLNADDVVVLAMPNLEVADAGSIYLTGGRPVAFAIFGSATVGGRIVAAPKPGDGDTVRGAGGSYPGLLTKAHCNVGGMTGRGIDGLSASNTSGGGGGGAFGLVAAAGGNGATYNNSGGPAGQANGNPEIVPLRGGCPGGQGGSNFAQGLTIGGYGGGALQLSVAGSLLLSGYLAAPGQGGEGCNANNNLNAGGSGAGSGGAVLIEANTLRLLPSAAITAHGGGGGEGDGDPQGGEPGDGGENGHVTNLGVAQGGTGGSPRGGKGGNGAVAGTAAAAGSAGTNSSGRNGGGGGGGASVGRVRLNILTQCRADAGIISPLFTGSCP